MEEAEKYIWPGVSLLTNQVSHALSIGKSV